MLKFGITTMWDSLKYPGLFLVWVQKGYNTDIGNVFLNDIDFLTLTATAYVDSFVSIRPRVQAVYL